MGSNDGIQERSFSFALRIIKICQYIEKDSIGRIIANQLLRSGTSIGANIEEAYAGQSKKDFIFKMSIALKEARETNYWLRILRDSEIVTDKRKKEIIEESEAVMNIVAQIIITAKNKLEKEH